MAGELTFEMDPDSFRVVLDEAAIRKLAGGPEIRGALIAAGQIGETAAKEFAPIDTGTLRRSITHEINGVGEDLFVRIGTNVSYAAFQELGTRFHPAHPYLRPAMETLRRVIRG